MAKLTKERARKPIVENGRCTWHTDHTTGAWTYGIFLYEEGAGSFKITMSADEMLMIVAEWLKHVAQNQTLAPKPRVR